MLLPKYVQVAIIVIHSNLHNCSTSLVHWLKFQLFQLAIFDKSINTLLDLIKKKHPKKLIYKHILR